MLGYRYFYISFLLIASFSLTATAEPIQKWVSSSKMSRVQIEEFLRTADVVSMESTKLGITKPKIITLVKDNIKLRALYKTHSTKIKHGKGRSKTKQLNNADRYQNELAAYQMDQLLGLNMIPATIFRKIERSKGAVQDWVENSIVEKTVYDSKSKVLDICAFKKQTAIMNVFDILIYNDDRNLGNVLYTLDNCRLWMIDHTRAFRIKSSIPKAIQSVKIRMSDDFANKLMSLNKKLLEDKLSQYLSYTQINFVLKRRDLIIKKWRKSGKPGFLAD